MPADLTQRIYAAFDPEPLTAQQMDRLYVDLDSVRGDYDPVERIAKKILLAGGKATCQVLAGHKGSGKSTELRRLQHRLESHVQKMFVVFCEVDEDIDRNDVDFPDLLVAMVRQLAMQIKDRCGIALKPGYFKDRIERLKSLLGSEVQLGDFDLETGLGKIGVIIKGSPDARAQIRKLMEPDAGNLLHAANDVISKAVLELRKQGYHGLAIIVDDLDKMTVRPHADAGCSTAEYLFVQRAAQLTAFHCHVVYSMPISLAYSHQQANIRANYGGHVSVIPMTKVASPPPASKPHEPGVARFRDIVDRRLRVASASRGDCFDSDEVLDELIRLSGGQPTELMTLVRESIITDALPIGKDSLARALREGKREYARQLRAEHQPIIDEVRKTGWFARTEASEPLFRELLESRAILQYVNANEWYGLNPMVEALQSPAPPVRRATYPQRKQPSKRRR